MGSSRPLFCGNFEYDARQSEIERLFDRYGRIARIDMKMGQCQRQCPRTPPAPPCARRSLPPREAEGGHCPEAEGRPLCEGATL